MKKILFAFLMCSLFAHIAAAQEVVSEVSEYVTYQDSFFVLKKTTITNNGLDGINDTTVVFGSAVDSSGLVNQILADHLNAVNRGAARWRANFNYRMILADKSAADDNLEMLNSNLDSLVRNQYSRSLTGRYRFFEDDGSDFFVNVEEHPVRPDLLRGQREDDLTFVNILPFSRWLLRVSWGPGDVVYLFWDGVDSTRPVFRHGSANLPAAMVERDNRRIVKLD